MSPVDGGLVIGLGNPWRGDDGVGWRLAAAVGGRCVRQLTPDLAAWLVAPQRVLFIDAWLAPRRCRRPRLRPLVAVDGDGSSHGLPPAALLTLATSLYDVRPEAALLLVPIVTCPHGRRLSSAVRWQLPTARRLLRRWQTAGPCTS